MLKALLQHLTIDTTMTLNPRLICRVAFSDLLAAITSCAKRYFLHAHVHTTGNRRQPVVHGLRRMQLHPCFASSLRIAQVSKTQHRYCMCLPLTTFTTSTSLAACAHHWKQAASCGAWPKAHAAASLLCQQPTHGPGGQFLIAILHLSAAIVVCSCIPVLQAAYA